MSIKAWADPQADRGCEWPTMNGAVCLRVEGWSIDRKSASMVGPVTAVEAEFIDGSVVRVEIEDSDAGPVVGNVSQQIAYAAFLRPPSLPVEAVVRHALRIATRVDRRDRASARGHR